MLYDMLALVQSELNFNFTMVPSTEGKYGSLNKQNQKWTGQIGMLQRGEIDFSIMDLTVTFERAQVCKSLMNTYDSRYLDCCTLNNST